MPKHDQSASSMENLVALPFNRKERYFTGTVLPMVIGCQDFAHLHKFVRLCGLALEPIHSDLTGFQFFSEYSFMDSVVTGSDLETFADRPLVADTPDLVIRGRDWLLAVEAKVFHRPSKQALVQQMARQRVLVDYWAKKLGLDPERVVHTLLLPSALAEARPDMGLPIVTFESVIKEFLSVAPAYWLGVLRMASDRYAELASPEPTFGGNAEDFVRGSDIVKDHGKKSFPYRWMGRAGGLKGVALVGDLESGTWRERTYEVRESEPPQPHRNWFLIADFVDRVRAQQ